MSNVGSSDYRYWAFISYSHSDNQARWWQRFRSRRWADWLHKAIETYSIPVDLVGKETPLWNIPKRIAPVFVDRSEMACSANVHASIQEALHQSRALIVICSPSSARSRWVEEEVLIFKRLNRSERIVAVIVDGDPNECFCNALRYEMVNGNLSNRRIEPLAADVRKSGDGPRDALMRIISGVLGISFDELKRREQRRRDRRRALVSAAGIALIVLFAVIAVTAHVGWNRADHLLLEAEKKLAVAALDNGMSLCEEGEVGKGMLWLNRCLELAPVDSDGLRQLARANLAIWSRWLMSPSPILAASQSEVSAVTFSSDGRWAAYSSYNVVRLWDVIHNIEVCDPLLHDQPINAIAFSPDSTCLLIATSEIGGDKNQGEIRLWEVHSGNPLLAQVIRGKSAETPAFSKDGRFVVTRDLNWNLEIWDRHFEKKKLSVECDQFVLCPNSNFLGTAKRVKTGAKEVYSSQVWNVESGEKIGSSVEHELEVNAMEFSQNSKYFVLGSGDLRTKRETKGEVRVCRVTTGETVCGPRPHSSAVDLVAFSPTGEAFLTGTNEEFRLWRTDNGELIGEPHKIKVRLSLRHHRTSFTFSPNGRSALLSVGTFKTPSPVPRDYYGGNPWGQGMVWLLKFGPDGLSVLPLNLKNGVFATAFSRDGELGVTVSQDGIRLWDVGNGELIGKPAAQDHRVEYAAVQKNQIFVYAGEAVRIWHLPPVWRNSNWFVDHDHPYSVAVSTDGNVALACRTGFPLATDKTFTLLNDRTGRIMELTHNDWIRSAAMTSDGRMVATGSTNEVKLWKTESRVTSVRKLPVQGSVDVVKFSPDGSALVTVSDGEGKLWRKLDADSPVAKLVGSEFSSAEFSPNSKKLVLFKNDSFELWDVDSQERIGRIAPSAGPVSFSSDSKAILVTLEYGEKTVRAWSSSTADPLGPPVDEVIAASRNCKVYLTASPPFRTGRLVDSSSGEQIGQSMVHGASIHVAAFSPDGRLILTGGGGPVAQHRSSTDWAEFGESRLWSAETGEPIGQTIEHRSPVRGIAFGEDGMTFTIRNWDSSVRIWSAELVRPIGMPFHDSTFSEIQLGSDLIKFERNRMGSIAPDARFWLRAFKPTRRWILPASIYGEVDRIGLWVRAKTGLKLDDSGTVLKLREADWKRAVQEIEKSGSISIR